METGEVIYEKVHASPRPPPKISLKHDWMKELGSEVAQRPEGQVVQQFIGSQSNQSTPNPSHDRTGQPVVIPQRGARPQQFIIGDDEAELDLPVGSRSFLDRVNDQVRKKDNDLR